MSSNSVFGWVDEYRNNHNACDIDIDIDVNGIFVTIKYNYRGWQYTCEKYCFDPRDNTFTDIRNGFRKKNNPHWKECSSEDWTFIFKEIKRQISNCQEKEKDFQKYISGEKPAIIPIPLFEDRVNELKDEISNLSWLA